MRTAIIENGAVVNIVELGVQPHSPKLAEHVIAPAGKLFVPSATAQIGDTYVNGAIVPQPTPPPPELTPAQAFAAALAPGLAIVSTGTPALNGTYAITKPFTDNIGGIAAGIAARNRVPGGGADFDYPDAAGASHTFTGAQFLDFAAAVEDYVYAVSRGQTPSQPVTIP